MLVDAQQGSYSELDPVHCSTTNILTKDHFAKLQIALGRTLRTLADTQDTWDTQTDNITHICYNVTFVTVIINIIITRPSLWLAI